MISCDLCVYNPSSWHLPLSIVFDKWLCDEQCYDKNKESNWNMLTCSLKQMEDNRMFIHFEFGGAALSCIIYITLLVMTSGVKQKNRITTYVFVESLSCKTNTLFKCDNNSHCSVELMYCWVICIFDWYYGMSQKKSTYESVMHDWLVSPPWECECISH